MISGGKLMNTITKIKKRDGRIVEFDREKIADAIFKAAQVLGGREKYLQLKIDRTR